MSRRSYNIGTRTDKWPWLQMVASEKGPPSPTTRHVLHVLAMHMNQRGRNAFPSQAHIAMRTGLSERCVQNQIEKARLLGWLNVHLKGRGGQGWRQYEYVAAVPPALEEEVPEHVWVTDPQFRREEPDPPRDQKSDLSATPVPTKGAERGSGRSPSAIPPAKTEGAEPHAKGAEPHDTTCRTSRQNVLNDVLTNYPLTIPKNYPKESALASEHTDFSFSLSRKSRKREETEESLAKKARDSAALLAKAVREMPEINDDRLAQMYGTDLATVQEARRAIQ